MSLSLCSERGLFYTCIQIRGRKLNIDPTYKWNIADKIVKEAANLGKVSEQCNSNIIKDDGVCNGNN